MLMPSGRKVSYVSKEASPYADSDMVVIEEDCISEDEAQRNVVSREEHAPCEKMPSNVSTHVLSRQRLRDGLSSSGSMCKVLLGSPPRAQGGEDIGVNLMLP